MAEGWDGWKFPCIPPGIPPARGALGCRAGHLDALGLPEHRKATWLLSNKLLKKDFKLWGGAGVAMLCPWDHLTIVSFFAEIWYHSKLQSTVDLSKQLWKHQFLQILKTGREKYKMVEKRKAFHTLTK